MGREGEEQGSHAQVIHEVFPSPALSRTRWACGVCFELYQERKYAGRADPADRLRIGVCKRCKLLARARILERERGRR